MTEKLSRNLELEKRRSESLEQKAKNAFRKSGLSDIGCEVSSSIDFFVCYRNHSSGLETGVYRISANSFRAFAESIQGRKLELVSKELNHLAAILHVYAGGLNFMK